MFNENEKGNLSKDDLVKAIHALESFHIRRLICGETSRPYSRWFPQAIKKIKDGEKKGLKIIDSLLNFLNEKGWPDDEQFRTKLITFPVYSRTPNVCRMLLEELEKSYGHKEPVDLSSPNIQIEHIMPQTLSDEWKMELGSEWERIYKTYLHTIGNLTLSGYNQELCNNSFPQKRERLVKSNFMLNSYFREIKQWTEMEIIKRANKLADYIITLWPKYTH